MRKLARAIQAMKQLKSRLSGDYLYLKLIKIRLKLFICLLLDYTIFIHYINSPLDFFLMFSGIRSYVKKKIFF